MQSYEVVKCYWDKTGLTQASWGGGETLPSNIVGNLKTKAGFTARLYVTLPELISCIPKKCFSGLPKMTSEWRHVRMTFVKTNGSWKKNTKRTFLDEEPIGVHQKMYEPCRQTVISNYDQEGRNCKQLYSSFGIYIPQNYVIEKTESKIMWQVLGLSTCIYAKILADIFDDGVILYI